MEPTVAYLASGRLFVKAPGQDAREIESPFAEETAARQAKLQATDGWKSRSGVWGTMGMAPPEWSQWEQSSEPRRRACIRSLSRGTNANELLYLLDLGNVHGLLRYDLAQNREYRLMHRNGFPASSLASHSSGQLAVALQRDDGTIGLAFSSTEGRHWNHVKGGDAVDHSPAWIPGERPGVVYQSAQVGRNAHGGFAGLGPYSVERLNLEDGSGPVRLLEDSETDFLLPRLTADGSLYCIRRPYRPPGRGEADWWTLLKDVVLFPFRLLRAIFHFLNFFSVMFSGQPLATAGAPRPAPPHQRHLLLWGHMIDTKLALERASRESERSLVPKTWELVQRGADGTLRVVAKNVLFYDLCRDGGVVFTNGSGIFYRDAQGAQRRLCEHDLVECLIVLE